VTLLAIADREGFVYGSRNGLERTANIAWDEARDENPWEALMSPDPDSSDLLRNPENEGRRIEAVPGGFRILNYLYYRSLRNEDDRREQNRVAQQRFRDKVSQSKPKSATVIHAKTVSASPSASASSSLEGDRECEGKRKPKSVDEVVAYAQTINVSESDARAFFASKEACGWTRGGKPLKDWKQHLVSWRDYGYLASHKKPRPGVKPERPSRQTEADRWYEKKYGQASD